MSRCKSVVKVGKTLRRCRWGEGHPNNGENVFAFHAAGTISHKATGKYAVAWTEDQIAGVTPESVVHEKAKTALGFEASDVVLAHRIEDPRPSDEE